jgi:5-methylcytosine-specific restriction protein A
MPRRAPRPCAVPGCPNLVYAGSRCDKHLLPKDRTRETVRASASSRGYGPEWTKKRDAYARAHPWCEDPYGIHQGQLVRMKIVDHIIPRRQGGKDEKNNFRSLCQTCHNYKTAHDGSRQQGGGDPNLQTREG